MADTKYTLRYLPLFYEDLEHKVAYIAVNLANKKAADDLIVTSRTEIIFYKTLRRSHLNTFEMAHIIS